MTNKINDGGRPPAYHELKVHTEFFDAILEGRKTFEVRKNDRGFMVGDFIILRSYDPYANVYTGNRIRVMVKYVLPGGKFGIEEGYCVLGIVRKEQP